MEGSELISINLLFIGHLFIYLSRVMQSLVPRLVGGGTHPTLAELTVYKDR